MATKRITDPSVYRGPVRAKRRLIGAPSVLPVPISRFAARIQPESGIVAKFSQANQKSVKRFDTKVAGAI